MQNRTDSGIPHFSAPQTKISSSRHHNKSDQMHEIQDKSL